MTPDESPVVVLLYMVDEDELVALSALLASLGFQVVPVESLDEGRRALAEHRVDCAFVEVRSTHPQGLAALRNIKQAQPQVPAVVLSPSDDVASRIAARDAGAEHSLSTPIRGIDLEMKLAELRRSLPGSPAPTGALEALPLPEPAERSADPVAQLPLPEPDTELARENERLREDLAALKARLGSAQKSEAAALRDAASAALELQRRDQSQLARGQAQAPARQAPSIAGGHPPDTDDLTGLIGAGPLQDHLDREFARARRYGHDLSILILDLDRLARYGKKYGSTACDRALCLVADVLRSALRSPDIAARVGEDDFVILATDTSSEQALLLAERLRAALREEGKHTSQPPITVSIGIASSARQELRRSEDLLQAAQDALRQAKRAGRDRSVAAESRLER